MIKKPIFDVKLQRKTGQTQKGNEVKWVKYLKKWFVL